MLNHTGEKETTSCDQSLYSCVSRVPARHVRAATFKIFIAFGAQTATYVQRYKSKPGSNPIYADWKKLVNSSPGENGPPRAFASYAGVCRVGKRAARIKNTCVANYEVNGYIAISSRKYGRALVNPLPVHRV